MAQPGGIEDITTEQFDRVLKTNPVRDVLSVHEGDTAHAAGSEVLGVTGGTPLK